MLDNQVIAFQQLAKNVNLPSLATLAEERLDPSMYNEYRQMNGFGL